MNNFMVRFLYEAFFELCLCALINVSTMTSGPGGMGTWFMSLIVLIACMTAMLAVFSLYFRNGPYLNGVYQKGSILTSFWGVRPLSEQIKNMALATEDKTIGLTKKSSMQDASPIDMSAADGGSPMKSRTSSIYNSNIPLNQQMFSAVQMNND